MQAGAGQLVLAGSGCESTRETIEMTSAMAGEIIPLGEMIKILRKQILKIEMILYIAAEAGSDVAVVYTPCYYKVFL